MTRLPVPPSSFLTAPPGDVCRGRRKFLSTACGNVVVCCNLMRSLTPKYQHYDPPFHTHPEQKWALAGLPQNSKLVSAFLPLISASIPRTVMLREARVRTEFAHLYPMLE